jgi:hypothetical protein
MMISHTGPTDQQRTVGHLSLALTELEDGGSTLTITDTHAGHITVPDPSTATALAAAITALSAPPPVLEASPSLGDLAEVLRSADEAEAAARAADCGVPGCDRLFHTAVEDPSEWNHHIGQRQHLGMEVDLVQDAAGAITAEVHLKIEDTHDADGLRQLSVQLRLLAEAVLEDADILDRRARRLHRPSDVVDALRDLEG